MYSIREVSQRYHLFLFLFVLLSTAVTDEFIQIFTGRTSSVKDILIDFGGAAAGLVLAAVIMTLYRRISGRR